MIVPDGVLFGSSKAHKSLRKMLVEEQKLDGVISMPSGVFKPYAGVSTAILLFTKTNSGGTDNVWFYKMEADGFSLDDKRTPQPDKAICRICWPAGRTGRTKASASAPNRASWCPGRKSPETTMTCPSTATRKWSTRRWNMSRRR